jgi:blue light- and temperature-responsive anti-repressor
LALRVDTNVADSDAMIGCLTYQSTACYTPSSGDLEGMVSKARERNHSLGVTGMLLYENGKFLQTLEGPAKGLDQIWTSIRQDDRHRNIEVLSEHVVSGRLFSDWDLLLYNRDTDKCSASLKVDAGENELLIDTRQLARLALSGDDVGLNASLAAVAENGLAGDEIIARLIEPTARAMGDAWLADECCELDLTIGLSMLQMAAHAVRYANTANCIRASRYSILLATAPCEAHMLGTSLLADQFTDAGWQVDMAFPANEQELVNQINAQHPDAIDIGLSDALPRYDSLADLRKTVELSRQASGNHPAVISVGGRLFAEAVATAGSVGADNARKTIAGASVRVAELVRQRRSSH